MMKQPKAADDPIDRLLMAKKADIKQVNDAARQTGLTPGQREILHEHLRDYKGPDGKVSFGQLVELAEQIKKEFPNK